MYRAESTANFGKPRASVFGIGSLASQSGKGKNNTVTNLQLTGGKAISTSGS